jgi:hypothetical protein
MEWWNSWAYGIRYSTKDNKFRTSLKKQNIQTKLVCLLEMESIFLKSI